MSGGRQRTFDKNQALQQAMNIFWQKGYVATSLADLTAAMGINKPSLYAAFGNKESLFVSAADHYIESYPQQCVHLLQQKEKSAEEQLTDYLLAILDNQCDPELPGGCLISMAVSEAHGDEMPNSAIDCVRDASQASEAYLADFLAQEKKAGNLPAKIDPKSAATFLQTMMHGTALQSRNGKTRDELAPILVQAVKQLVN